MNSSTTNNTTGETGWRIAHADMFFMTRSPLETPTAELS
jgi:hypothetical protein